MGAVCCVFCFFKQKTAYEMRISDWSSDVCSSDLDTPRRPRRSGLHKEFGAMMNGLVYYVPALILLLLFLSATIKILREYERGVVFTLGRFTGRSEEHTSELQSLMSISYAVFCLTQKTYNMHT